ncbi:PAQR family membrane homeostasis protein TrhA [Dokdonella fugitiva]|uniref:PAQR family membrane homeostasis protein TrhA n=1 Tax=Dokdonella fugitiva TaxID=328517 RepID=UPI0015FACE23|nr:hemolysin III family protein [Dokdonella fugitiva]MBA8884731.1 hemolysin III [Dokdonella fugitiva]
MTTSVAPRYSGSEEIASSLIHGIGIVLSIAGLAALVAFAARDGEARHVASVSVYGASLILLYTASTLYHGIPSPRAKPVLRTLDHAAIFLLIAGTYTPFTLISLEGAWGWSLFVLVWLLAFAGIGLELAGVKNRKVMAALYVCLGWIGLVAIKPLLASIAAPGLWLLFGGGAAYTLGVPFYLSRRLPYSHALWHLFVLLGSVLQFFAVLFYVLPPAA